MLLGLRKQWMWTVLVISGSLMFLGCTVHSEGPGKIEPAKVEKVSGSKFARVTLTERAVERLGLETVQAGDMDVPYGALIYGLHGETYVYTNPEPLVYVRTSIKVDDIEGDTVYLAEGLAPGTMVVTFGAAELYGAEAGIGM